MTGTATAPAPDHALKTTTGSKALLLVAHLITPALDEAAGMGLRIERPADRPQIALMAVSGVLQVLADAGNKVTLPAPGTRCGARTIIRRGTGETGD